MMTTHWTSLRKAALLDSIKNGEMTEADAMERHGISKEELELWRTAIQRRGVAGLRVTRLTKYRRYENQCA